MDENNEKLETIENVPESPKPLAFTVDFNDGKQIDTQRHRSLVEKFQKKHRRGQSLSKIDEPPSSSNGSNSSSSNNTTTITANKKHPSTGNLPRKSNFQSDGYLSSDEKTTTNNNNNNRNYKRSELSLTLKNTFSDKMSQSFPNAGCLFNVETPVIELKDVSSPELDLISPFSPKVLPTNGYKNKLTTSPPPLQQSSPINHGNYNNNNNNSNNHKLDDEQFIDGTEFDFDKKSDTVSDTGTYTLDADNYSEEQKARMSIDAQFKIEQVSVMKKTEDYINSLYNLKEAEEESIKKIDNLTTTILLKQQQQHRTNNRLLSPILSPTQNLSITESLVDNNNKQPNDDDLNKTFTRILFPSPKAKNNGLDQLVDQGSVISVTSSGAFRTKNTEDDDNAGMHRRKKSLTQSEIHVEAYLGGQQQFETNQLIKNKKLTTNIINVQSIYNNNNNNNSNINSGDNESNLNKITNLPPNGKLSPTKIPSPIHTITRPRSRNCLNIDLSDSSLETESYLRSTQNCINTLKQHLSLDSDHDQDDDDDDRSDVNNKKLNNLLNKQKTAHTRHNSLDDKISNKLEHFHLKNLQTIDQTTNMFNQYNQQQFMHKIQNSPNNSPIRRSSSFSTKNLVTKNTNLATSQQFPQQQQKETNLKNSPNFTRPTTTSSSIQRSASTANIKPNYLLRRSSINSDQLQHHSKIDRNQFGDTDTSSEEDFDKQLTKKKDLSLLTNTRYNRAFSLRRGRLDDSTTTTTAKCPNTPEMRRKFPTEIRTERAISVDRKPIKTNEVQSRYLLNITKKPATTPSPIRNDLTTIKNVPKIQTTPVGGGNSNNLTKTTATPKNQVFSRTDSGRFSTRSGKPPTGSGTSKNTKKDQVKKSGGRSNSSLSSREKEFQNWKRRKSYDPMKAAAEGKRKELAKKQTNIMTQSYNAEANHQNQDCDSSPSHSSSVHRSQSFHGTAALGQLISSEDEEDDLTLSADEGFSPPTPSPCELSPARAILRNAWKDHILH